MVRYWIALCLASLAGAAAAQPAGPAAPIEGMDARIWDAGAQSGAIVHRRSGVAFADRFGNFRLFRVAAVGSDGSDVILNYRHPRDGGHDTTVTVYLFQPGALPEHRLAPSIAAIGARSPEAFLWSDGPFLIGSTPDLRGHKAAFKTGIGPNTVMDYLYFAPLGRWTVKVRATLDSPTDVENEGEIDALVRALPWDQVLRANGPCEGRACTLTGVYPVNSHYLEMLLPAQPNPDIVYRSGDFRLVHWPDALIQFFERTYGRLSVRSPLHAVELRRDGQWKIVRFFSGRPSEAEFQAQVAQLTRLPEGSPFIRAGQVAQYLGE